MPKFEHLRHKHSVGFETTTIDGLGSGADAKQREFEPHRALGWLRWNQQDLPMRSGRVDPEIARDAAQTVGSFVRRSLSPSWTS